MTSDVMYVKYDIIEKFKSRIDFLWHFKVFKKGFELTWKVWNLVWRSIKYEDLSI